jgi:hypothetical protein
MGRRTTDTGNRVVGTTDHGTVGKAEITRAKAEITKPKLKLGKQKAERFSTD